MRFDVLTIFPEMFQAITQYGVTSRAFSKEILHLKTWNPRDFTSDPRKTVDDRAYGGGPGMVMMVGPLETSLQAVKKDIASSSNKQGPTVLMSPQGRVFDQDLAKELSQLEQITFVCGRYEAVDQRFIERNVDFELSIGDYVVSGGELPALVVMDSLIRLMPNVLGDANSAQQDSFSEGLLDCPHYTRPENYENFLVPGVLLGGHHGRIEDWRRNEALIATQKSRPDLILVARKKGLLSKKDEKVLQDFLETLVSGLSK
jgi:tRNA (guanine37-N1)-methyltransferase